ncbi:MAG: AMP-binding protein, partial [Ornithinimicrobium sp.]
MVQLPNVRSGPDGDEELDIVAMLQLRATERPNHRFVRTQINAITYAEMEIYSARLAGALRDIGVGRGQAVVVLMANSVEQVVVWFALARLGALHVPVNTALVGARLHHVLAISRPVLVVADEDLTDHVNVDGALGSGITVVVHRPPGVHSTHPSDALLLADLIDFGEPVGPVASDPLDDATLMFTSGTTGASKACVLSRRYLAAQGAGHAANLHLGADDVLYCPFPLFHIDAATLTVAAALSVGATAALGRRFSASGFWDEVHLFDATVFNFMGATLTILWKQPPADRDRDHRVRLAWGVPMPEWQARWEARFGISLYQVYGSTDAGDCVSDPIDGSQRPGAAGRVADLY